MCIDPSHQKSLSRRGPDWGRSVGSVCVGRVLLDLVETRELWLGMVVNYLRPLRVCRFLGALQTIVVRALSDRQDRGGIWFGIVRASKTTAATRFFLSLGILMKTPLNTMFWVVF